MKTETLIGILAYAIFLGSALLGVYLRRTKIVYVTDFQVGLRFGKGESYTRLSAGSYRTNAGSNPITIVDMRPRQFIVERMTFRNAFLANAVISIGAELIVSDPEVANNMLKNIFEDSLTTVRECLGPAAASSLIDLSQVGKEKLATAITSEINTALQSSGMLIRNLEITELWVQHTEPALQTKAN